MRLTKPQIELLKTYFSCIGFLTGHQNINNALKDAPKEIKDRVHTWWWEYLTK